MPGRSLLGWRAGLVVAACAASRVPLKVDCRVIICVIVLHVLTEPGEISARPGAAHDRAVVEFAPLAVILVEDVFVVAVDGRRRPVQTAW